MAPFKAIDEPPGFIRASRFRVRKVLAESKGVMRLSELVEEARGSERAVRRELERLQEEGEVRFGTVGERTIVRVEGELREEAKNRRT